MEEALHAASGTTPSCELLEEALRRHWCFYGVEHVEQEQDDGRNGQQGDDFGGLQLVSNLLNQVVHCTGAVQDHTHDKRQAIESDGDVAEGLCILAAGLGLDVELVAGLHGQFLYVVCLHQGIDGASQSRNVTAEHYGEHQGHDGQRLVVFYGGALRHASACGLIGIFHYFEN